MDTKRVLGGMARGICGLVLVLAALGAGRTQADAEATASPPLPDGSPTPFRPATATPDGRLGNPSPKNSGERFFAADFTTGEGWTAFSIPEGGAYTAGIDRGVLYLEAPEAFQNVYVLYDLSLVAPDVRLEVVVENRASVTANNISLVCRANQEGWYEFSLNSGGFWHIWKLADGAYTELATGASKVINQKRAQNQLAATCIGSQLALYVNYRKIGSVRDRSFLDGGQVGVGLSTFGIPGAAADFARFSASLP